MLTRLALLALCTIAATAAAAVPTTTPSADGVAIAYRVQGKGTPALVLVHCWTCDSSFWDAQVKHLALEHQVVTLDLAGHGRSGAGRAQWTIPAFADDVVAVVTKLGLKQVVLVGHSMGGPVVVEAARKMPERVAGLIPVDTLLDVDQVMGTAEVDAATAEMQADFKGATGRFIRQYMFVPTSPAALVEDVVARTAAFDPKIALGALHSTWTYDPRPALSQIKVPIVAVNADKFPTRLDHARQYAPQYDALIVRGVGHYLMREDPAAFNAQLARAVARVTGTAQPLAPR